MASRSTPDLSSTTPWPHLYCFTFIRLSRTIFLNCTLRCMCCYNIQLHSLLNPVSAQMFQFYSHFPISTYSFKKSKWVVRRNGDKEFAQSIPWSSFIKAEFSESRPKIGTVQRKCRRATRAAEELYKNPLLAIQLCSEFWHSTRRIFEFCSFFTSHGK